MMTIPISRRNRQGSDRDGTEMILQADFHENPIRDKSIKEYLEGKWKERGVASTMAVRES